MINDVLLEYPKLKHPMVKYEKLIHNFFSLMYEGVKFRVISFDEGFFIIVYDVNEKYHPSQFDPIYHIKNENNEITYLNQYDLFLNFYSYLFEIVPYLNFKLIHPYGESFVQFDLKQFYHQKESESMFLMAK